MQTFFVCFGQKHPMITLNEFLKEKEMATARVLSGEENLDRIIRWYHIIEIEKLGNWVEPNILVFMTGVALKEMNVSLMNIVKALSDLHAVGLVINVGRFISYVPDQVVNYARQLSFPIITIEEKEKLVNVTYKLSKLIFQSKAKERNYQDILRHCLKDNDEAYEQNLLQILDFKHDDTYRIIKMINPEELRNKEKWEIVMIQLKKQLEQNMNERMLFTDYGNFTVIMINMKHSAHQTAEYIANRIAFYINIRQSEIKMSVSRRYRRLDFLPSAYENVNSSMKFIDLNLFSDSSIIYSDELGIFNLVDLSDIEKIEEIITDYLGELPCYPDLMESLQTYLVNGLNTKKTADALFIHVNSMKYRLNRIRDILPVKLEGTNLYHLQTALFLYQIITEKQKKKSGL